jgi:hypothetical protein
MNGLVVRKEHLQVLHQQAAPVRGSACGKRLFSFHMLVLSRSCQVDRFYATNGSKKGVFRTTRPSSSCDAFEAAVVAAAASVAAAAAAAAAGAAAVGRKCSWAARPPRIDDASQSRCATTIICPPFPFQSFERFRPESVLANLLFAVFKRNGFRNGFLHTS